MKFSTIFDRPRHLAGKSPILLVFNRIEKHVLRRLTLPTANHYHRTTHGPILFIILA